MKNILQRKSTIALKESIQSEINDIKDLAKNQSLDDLKSGLWFTNFISYALKNYSEKVNAVYFQTKYPNVPVEGVVSNRIKIAKKYAAIGGGITGGAYAGVVAATIGSGGGASPLTIPAAITAFTVDLMYTTRLQLQLAYDLSILYNRKIDLNDPEDISDLINVAFGIKAAQKFTDAMSKTAPGFVRYGVKQIATGKSLQLLKSVPVIGKHLLQRNIIKFSIPVVSIALNSGINYFFTGKIANQAKKIYKSRAIIEEKSKDLSLLINDEFITFLEVVWLVVLVDGKVDRYEVDLMKDLTDLVLEKSEKDIQDQVKVLSNRINISKDKVFEKVELLDNDTKEIIYQSACLTANIDGKLAKKELKLLEQLATVTGQTYDLKNIKEMI